MSLISIWSVYCKLISPVGGWLVYLYGIDEVKFTITVVILFATLGNSAFKKDYTRVLRSERRANAFLVVIAIITISGFFGSSLKDIANYVGIHVENKWSSLFKRNIQPITKPLPPAKAAQTLPALASPVAMSSDKPIEPPNSQSKPIPAPTKSSSPLQQLSSGNTFVPNNHVTPGSEKDLVDNVGNIIFFAYNDATLSDDSKTTLALQAEWLAKYPSVNVLVAGNADGTGSEEDALGLAQQRALAAQAYLVSQGVAPSRIQTISFGKDCPIVAGNDPVAAEQNRNVITSIQGDNPQGCEGVLPDPSSISSLVTLPPGTVVPAP